MASVLVSFRRSRIHLLVQIRREVGGCSGMSVCVLSPAGSLSLVRSPSAGSGKVSILSRSSRSAAGLTEQITVGSVLLSSLNFFVNHFLLCLRNIVLWLENYLVISGREDL